MTNQATGVLPPVIWLVLDGLPWWLVNQFMDRLPFMGYINSSRRIAPLKPLHPNCQTPPSLMTLWSGVRCDHHGLTGYDVPVPSMDRPLKYENGFIRYPRNIKMIWDSYAERGLPVSLMSIPFVDAHSVSRCLKSRLDVFTSKAVHPLLLEPGEALRVHGIGLSWRQDTGNETVVRLGETEFPLPTEGDWHELTVEGLPRLYASMIRLDVGIRLAILGYRAFKQQVGFELETIKQGTCCPFGADSLYRNGALGRKISDQGTGAAERLLCDGLLYEYAVLMNQFTMQLSDGGFRLAVGYAHIIDLWLHETLDQFLNGSLSARSLLTELTSKILLRIDLDLCRLAGTYGDNYHIIVNSDHGMDSINKVILPNVVLHSAGLLYLNGEDGIDLEKSDAFFHPAENGLLAIRNGANPNRIRQSLVAAFEEVGLTGCSLIELEHGTPFDQDVFPFDHRFYLRPPVGCRAKFDLLGGEPVRSSLKMGDHTVDNGTSRLWGTVLDLGQPFLPDDRQWELCDLVSMVTGMANG